MGKNKDHEQLEELQLLIDDAVIDEVLGVVKSGKEATVYCCRAPDGGLLAAKVYRSREMRSFAHDATYREGRLRRKNRYARAIDAKGKRGVAFAFDAWVRAEYETLRILRAAGADVPEPITQSGRVVVMEYIGDEEGPAPMLANAHLESDEAAFVLDAVVENIALALSCDRVHGDLSAYNVLSWNGGVRLIDFPQAVDPRFNHSALELLERDIERICGHLERFGVEADARGIARGLWGRWLRSEL